VRPIANFTLHAILAAAIAALATASAAAGPTGGKEEVYFTITLQEARAHRDGKGQQLEVQSYQWGTANSAVKLEPVRITSYQLGGNGVDAQARGANQVTMDDTAGKEKMQPGGGAASAGRVTGLATDPPDPAASVGGSQSVTVGGSRAESGLPTGKRQHKPFTITKPLDKGSVWIRVSSPWAGCRVGTHYPSLTLAGGGKRYHLQDVTVASCGGSAAMDDRPTEEVAFYYNKISF